MKSLCYQLTIIADRLSNGCNHVLVFLQIMRSLTLLTNWRCTPWIELGTIQIYLFMFELGFRVWGFWIIFLLVFGLFARPAAAKYYKFDLFKSGTCHSSSYRSWDECKDRRGQWQIWLLCSDQTKCTNSRSVLFNLATLSVQEGKIIRWRLRRKFWFTYFLGLRCLQPTVYLKVFWGTYFMIKNILAEAESVADENFWKSLILMSRTLWAYASRCSFPINASVQAYWCWQRLVDGFLCGNDESNTADRLMTACMWRDVHLA